MSYKKTMMSVAGLVANEYIMAAVKFGEFFASPHEGYAVIKEEVEETYEDLESLKWHLDYLWRSVRADDPDNYRDAAGTIQTKAVELASEAIQVAAMAKKFLETFRDEETANV